MVSSKHSERRKDVLLRRPSAWMRSTDGETTASCASRSWWPRARAEETAGETRLSIGEIEAELDRIDRVSSRISSLEQTYEKEPRVNREVLSRLETASQDTGEKVAAQSKVITELNYTVPRDIARIRSAIRHLQIKWRVFLSPLALAIAIILGMVFETKSNFLFWLFQ